MKKILIPSLNDTLWTEYPRIGTLACSRDLECAPIAELPPDCLFLVCMFPSLHPFLPHPPLPLFLCFMPTLPLIHMSHSVSIRPAPSLRQ